MKIKEETSDKRKKILIEVMVLILLIATAIVSLLVDFCIISLPDIMILRVKDVENLFFTLFTVQASVATVSIAIVSIITGITNDNIYGISVSKYITSIRPGFFKSNVLITSSLVFILINYFCVALLCPLQQSFCHRCTPQRVAE